MIGAFITFDGPDGAGKTTQARRLAAWLEAQGRDVVLTREPGGTPGAEEIRKLLVTGDPDRWSPETEILLFNAARRDHVERLIRPALQAGKTVICDRFIDSTLAYQGARSDALRAMAQDLHDQMIGLMPDLTVQLQLSTADMRRRFQDRGGLEQRFENKGLAFQQETARVYAQIAEANPDRILVVQGSGSEEAVAKRVRDAILSASHRFSELPEPFPMPA